MTIRTHIYIATLLALCACAGRNPTPPSAALQTVTPAPTPSTRSTPPPVECSKTTSPPAAHTPQQHNPDDWIEALPGVRVSRSRRSVMFDARVPIDVHGPTPLVFLEVLVCNAMTREHESLLVTDIPPSRVHAALLMLGLEPGSVGRWFFDGRTLRSSPPTGPRILTQVTLVRDGDEVTETLTCWAKNLATNRYACDDTDSWWVFAGSRFSRQPAGNIYAADAEGTLVGLTTFGTETIGWTRMHHHESRHEEPVWIADTTRVPPMGTKVKVILVAQ